MVGGFFGMSRCVAAVGSAAERLDWASAMRAARLGPALNLLITPLVARMFYLGIVTVAGV